MCGGVQCDVVLCVDVCVIGTHTYIPVLLVVVLLNIIAKIEKQLDRKKYLGGYVGKKGGESVRD
jgi:hypothetical protein